MGMRFRKSINLGGGFRINLSNSGIGYSWGFPGFRITKTAKGTTRKTTSIPGTGISWVEEHSDKSRATTKLPSAPREGGFKTALAKERLKSPPASSATTQTTLGGDNLTGPIQKNQLPNGQYVIGDDIPVGTFDFEVIHGSGIIKKFISGNQKETNYHEFAGGSWEKHFINVACREGEVLEIPNNMVVAISRSNKVVLEL